MVAAFVTFVLVFKAVFATSSLYLSTVSYLCY